MKIEATLVVPERVTVLTQGAEAPPTGVAFRAEDRSLYVDGERVGVLLRWPDEEGEPVYLGDPHAPSQFVVHRTNLYAVLDLP